MMEDRVDDCRSGEIRGIEPRDWLGQECRHCFYCNRRRVNGTVEFLFYFLSEMRNKGISRE